MRKAPEKKTPKRAPINGAQKNMARKPRSVVSGRGKTVMHKY